MEQRTISLRGPREVPANPGRPDRPFTVFGRSSWAPWPDASRPRDPQHRPRPTVRQRPTRPRACRQPVQCFDWNRSTAVFLSLSEALLIDLLGPSCGRRWHAQCSPGKPLKSLQPAGALMAKLTLERWALVLAGGDGTRLKSLTRQIVGREMPKQFCPIMGAKSKTSFSPVLKVYPAQSEPVSSAS